MSAVLGMMLIFKPLSLKEASVIDFCSQRPGCLQTHAFPHILLLLNRSLEHITRSLMIEIAFSVASAQR